MTTLRVANRMVLMCMALAFSTPSAHANSHTIREWAGIFYKPYFRSNPPDLYSHNLDKFFTRRFSSVYFAAARCGLLADDPFIGGAQPTQLTRLDIAAVQSDGVNANVTLGLTSTDGDQWQMQFRIANAKDGWLIDDVKMSTTANWWSVVIQSAIADDRRYHRC